jgi:fucose 4-O-acetylase-like acetyltransferase
LVHFANRDRKRYHSLDSLRAFLMLLGILLHAACSYVTFPLGEAWPYKDAQAVHPAFDLVVVFVHVFRMPLFFLLAGFFARLMLERRGPESLARNRFRRIVVPFVLGLCLLYLPTRLAFEYGQAQPGPDRLASGWSALYVRNTTLTCGS